jgi:hypothetical protein
LMVWLCGELDNERVEVRFDLKRLESSPGRTTHGWVLVDTSVVRVGDELLCQIVAQSDYAPVLRCYLLLERGGKLEFPADADEPGLEIRGLQLATGVAFVADVGEEAKVALGQWPAAVNAA